MNTTDSVDIDASERALALRNSIKLALSLVTTLAVAVGVRVLIPRHLGPTAFGQLHFAETFATTAFLFTVLGIDVYIRKEVAVRASHASEFLLGLLGTRVLLSTLALLGMAGVLWAVDRSAVEWRLAYVLAGWQAALVQNNTLAALLHARGTVNGLALINSATKLVWAAMVLGVMALGLGAEAVAMSFLITELARLALLLCDVRQRLGVEFRLNVRATRAVLYGSAPYFLHSLAHQLYARIDVQMLAVMTDDREVGWYGAAANLALAGMLLLPVVNAVVLPMGSRLHAHSEEAMHGAMRQAVRLVLVGGTGGALVLWFHAAELVSLFFGEGFEAAAHTLQILAPMFPLTYVAVLTSLHLIQLGRVWTVTKVSLLGLALNPLLNAFTIPAAWRWWGEGGAGMGAAMASVGNEVVVTAFTLGLLGRVAVDRQLATTTLRLALITGVVAALHALCSPLGPWRIPLEGTLFIAGCAVLGILPISEVIQRCEAALTRRRTQRSSSGTPPREDNP